MTSLTLECVLQWDNVLTPAVFQQMGRGKKALTAKLTQKLYISPATPQSYEDPLEL